MAKNEKPAGDAQKPRFWRYVGESVTRTADGSYVGPGVVWEHDGPPQVGGPAMWVPDDGPVQLVSAADFAPRVWTPLEVARGALAEHEPTTADWADQPTDEPTDEPAEGDKETDQ